MLEEVLRYVNNRFDRDQAGRRYGCAEGTFRVSGGSVEVDGLKDGQYFWVEGSVLNDGLHRYPAEDMEDEEFDGKVVFLVVPKAVQALSDEIDAWCEANAKTLGSPLQSESFGGYSYSRASANSESGSSPTSGWQLQFSSRLNQWRKLSRDWV